MVYNVLYSIVILMHNVVIVVSFFFFLDQKLYIYLSIYSTDDISFNKVAIQTHTHKGEGYSAQIAVDRNTETCMRTRDIGTSSEDKTVWWKVDLGGVYSIYSVVILFRNYDSYSILFFICRLTG